MAADESSTWYLRDGDSSVGPMTVQELKARLRAFTNWQSIYVWRVGLEDWVKAGSIPELDQVGPPPFKQGTERKSISRRTLPTVVLVVGITVGAAIGKVALQAIFQTKPLARPISVEEILAAAVAEQKPKLPVTLDDETTFVDMAAEGKILTYSYKVALDKIDVDLAGLRKGVLNMVCKNAGMKASLNMAATLRYKYVDQKSSPIGVVEITRADCG